MPTKERSFSGRIRPEIDNIIKEESEALGISRTEFVERVIEGTLPSRIEKMLKEHTAEIVAAIKANASKPEKPTGKK